MSNKFKHITFEDRQEIQLGLKAGLTLKEIASRIKKDPRTVSYEIKRNLTIVTSNRYLFGDGEKTYCQQHNKYPYVCDNCIYIKKCLSDKYYYKAKDAEKMYQSRLIESRVGANLSLNELANIESKLEEGLKNGQSIEHIANSNDFPITSRTLYRYIENNNIKIKPHQLRIKPRLKPKKKKDVSKVEVRERIKNRTIMDFLEHIKNHPGKFTVQLDTVQGLKTDTKVLMTLIVIEIHFFYAILLRRQSATEVKREFDNLEQTIGLRDFMDLFPHILTDRGFEFIHPHLIETSIDNYQRTRVYYCDPLASYQKGAIENYHRLLRYILPKGTSLEFLTPTKVNLINSHLNSYKIRSNNFVPSYDYMEKRFGKELLDKLKVRKINPDSIHLTPRIVK